MATPAEAAAQKLAWEVESRKSVEIRVGGPVASNIGDPTKKALLDTSEDHYIETAAGQRFWENQGFLSGKLTTRARHYSDGKRFADVLFDPRNLDRQQTVVVRRQFFMEGGNDRKQIPPPLLFLYVGRAPLHEALPKSQYLGTSKVIGRECDKFLFTQVRWSHPQDQIFHLDRETAIPLKFEAFRNPEARQRNEPVGEWTAESLDKVQGRYVPLKSTMTARGADGTVLLSWKYSVESIEFNKEYPASTFWPTVQQGVTILDESTGKTKTTPGKAVEPPARPETAAPVAAVPPADWTASAATASISVGVALVLTGGFLWWRRR